MAEMMSKNSFGSKENIETAKANGVIDAYDILLNKARTPVSLVMG